MKKIALTGNIGSGKSTVAGVFQYLGVPVFNADIAGHILLNNKNIISQIIKIFDDRVLDKKSINRKKLAEIVFSDSKSLLMLNAIIHPEVIKKFDEFCITNKHEPYVICESAIIFESLLNKLFDAFILVYAPKDVKIRRVMQRDNCTTKSVTDRLKNQKDDKLKMKMADYVIINDDKTLILPQIISIHNNILKNVRK